MVAFICSIIVISNIITTIITISIIVIISILALELRDYPPIMENQMEKKMENEMEAGGILGFEELKLSYYILQIKATRGHSSSDSMHGDP